LLLRLQVCLYISKISVSSASQKIAVKLVDEENKLRWNCSFCVKNTESFRISVTIERMGIAEIKKTASPSFMMD
jgi:hypothetical protein